MKILPLEYLKSLARSVARMNSYSPYSNFKVGAVVVDEDGSAHIGTNVENASYGLTICAERAAICSMIASGGKRIARVIIYTPTPEPTAPCGACRQVINEFASERVNVHSFCDGLHVINETVGELLPGAFGPRDLK